MIKVKSGLLKFDKYDKIGNIFPKECIVTMSEFIPVTIFNSADPDHSEQIGMVTSHTRDNHGIAIEAIINFESEELLKKLITEEDIYFGGYYKINKSHKENGVTVLDDIELKSVGVYLSDVFGDKSTLVSCLEKEGENINEEIAD